MLEILVADFEEYQTLVMLTALMEKGPLLQPTRLGCPPWAHHVCIGENKRCRTGLHFH